MLNLKKIANIFIIAAILIIMVSCAEDNPGNINNDDNAVTYSEDANTGSPDTEAIESEADKWAQEPHNLPENDFGGREFNVVTIESLNRVYNYFAVDEQTADPIVDAIYKRNLAIEERYNVTIKQVSQADPSGTARKSILAGDNQFDLIVDTIASMRALASQSLLTDLFAVPHIGDNINKPWWDQALIRDLSINKKLYFQAGNIVLKDKMRLACLYFNKDMCREIGIDYPYQYVYEGLWTIDKLIELTKGINYDVNGDGVMNQYDRWGLMSEWGFALMAFQGAGEKTVSLDKDGVPEITMNNPRALSVIQKILEFVTDPAAMFHADTIKSAGDIWLTASEYFQENRFLVRSSLFEAIPRDLRAMPADFGVLPMVKFDENQDNYYTYASADGLFISVPHNADADYAGLITEALAYESGSTLMPAFYDLSLTSKVLRDDESEGMLDIIFNNKVYDIGYIYGIGQLPGILGDLSRTGKTDFVSAFDKAQGSAEKALQKFIDDYDKE